MLVFYSLLLTIAMLVMSPLLLFRRQKYASGVSERLGNYPAFKQDERKVIWLHCVSVGETNAARPLVDELINQFPLHRIVISTTTSTGQELAKKIFQDKADAVFYFPFDWKFSVRRALRNYRPSLLLLMETEIWPRLIFEAKRSGSKVAMVNGRLSQRSLERYSKFRAFVHSILNNIDLALMQSENDAERIRSLGIEAERSKVTGNMKFDLSIGSGENAITDELRERFGFDGSKPLIIAASTHEPEEKWVLDAFQKIDRPCRLLLAPRHPERSDQVATLISDRGLSMARRSKLPSDFDKSADVILLDSIGELRAVYPFGDIVFVGGSLIPHGGQSILEPAVFGKAIITGPFMHNFADAVKIFLASRALIQISDASPETHLFDAFVDLFKNSELRQELGRNAHEVMIANRGAAAVTVMELQDLIGDK